MGRGFGFPEFGKFAENVEEDMPPAGEARIRLNPGIVNLVTTARFPAGYSQIVDLSAWLGF